MSEWEKAFEKVYPQHVTWHFSMMRQKRDGFKAGFEAGRLSALEEAAKIAEGFSENTYADMEGAAAKNALMYAVRAIREKLAKEK